MRTLVLILVAFIGSWTTQAVAEDFCVDTTAELYAALTAAAQSTAATNIRVHTGTYVLTSRLNYLASSDLHLSGGWQGASGACTSRSFDPDLTVLLGPANAPVMFVSLPANGLTNFTATGITFADGASTVLGTSACLTVNSETDSNAEIRIEGNSFASCDSDSTPGTALAIRARSAVAYIVNNKITNNQGIGSSVNIDAFGSSDVFISNNTVAYNPGQSKTGMSISGQSTDAFTLVNNVLWGNGDANGQDLYIAAGTPAVLNSNHVGRNLPFPATTVNIATSNSNPGFIGSTNLRPLRTASIRNSGVTANGQLANDLDGAMRVQGGRIDRGAYEYSEVFANGFE